MACIPQPAITNHRFSKLIKPSSPVESAFISFRTGCHYENKVTRNFDILVWCYQWVSGPMSEICLHTLNSSISGASYNVDPGVIMSPPLDMYNRDPHCINTHVQVSFEDILAEPEGANSIGCVWRMSRRCFNSWKAVCYKSLTLFCGMCIAAEWGCQFAVIAFIHVWSITPMFKAMDIQCGCLQKFWGMCVHCCMDPLCEACGLFFHAFKRTPEDINMNNSNIYHSYTSSTRLQSRK